MSQLVSDPLRGVTISVATCRGVLESPQNKKKVVPEATTTRTCPQSAVGCFCGFCLVLAIFLWDIEDFWKEDGKGWMDYCQNNLFDQHPALEKKVELLTGSLWPRSCR